MLHEEWGFKRTRKISKGKKDIKQEENSRQIHLGKNAVIGNSVKQAGEEKDVERKTKRINSSKAILLKIAFTKILPLLTFLQRFMMQYILSPPNDVFVLSQIHLIIFIILTIQQKGIDTQRFQVPGPKLHRYQKYLWQGCEFRPSSPNTCFSYQYPCQVISLKK